MRKDMSAESGGSRSRLEKVPNRRIEPLSSGEQNLRGDNAREIRKTGKNRRAEKNKRMVGRKKGVDKTLKKSLMGLGHTTQIPPTRINRVTRHQSPQSRQAVLNKSKTARGTTRRKRLRNRGGMRPKKRTLGTPQK